MAYTYNLNNAIGQVRWYSNDHEMDDPYNSDEEITLALSMVGNNIKLAAAGCLRAKASDKVYISKNFKIGNYSQNNTQISTDLLAQAKALEDNVEAAGIGLDGEYLGQEAVAEIAYTSFNWLEILKNKSLRGDVD